MKIRLVGLREQLRATYWFASGLIALAALGLAATTTYLDWLAQHGRLPGLERLYVIVTDASGAQFVLSTIAGSPIMVAGVIFSVTIVVLNMASGQLGPRLLRNFMEHAGRTRPRGLRTLLPRHGRDARTRAR